MDPQLAQKRDLQPILLKKGFGTTLYSRDVLTVSTLPPRVGGLGKVPQGRQESRQGKESKSRPRSCEGLESVCVVALYIGLRHFGLPIDAPFDSSSMPDL